MKILIVNKFLHANGGSETYIFQVGKRFKELGHEVQYFGMDHPDRAVGNDWNCYTDNMDFHEGKKNLLRQIKYPFQIIYSREAYRKLTFVLERFDPDAVHFNNFNFQLTPSVLYAVKNYRKKKRKKLPIVMTAHDCQLVCPNHLMTIPSSGEICFACEGGKFGNCIKNKCIHNSTARSALAAAEAYLYRWLRAYRYIDLLVCPSDFLREKLSTYPLLAKRAVTIHNFVQMDAGGIANNVEKEDYILYFGRYSKEKGVETLLKVCENLPEIPFVFAGTGPLKEKVSQVKNIKERGFLSGRELYQTIAKARLALFPSICNENCPFSVMEAQMCGTPVLGSRLGGIPELIEENVTGKLLPAGDAEVWTKEVEKLWEDKAALKAYADNCRNVSFCTVAGYCDILLNKIKEFL
ncbi:MAG: glycosyltransferase family 4 protein [Clostridium sp.]|nr:glycosyltransferase family 4 protein [Clostridium sp.]